MEYSKTFGVENFGQEFDQDQFLKSIFATSTDDIKATTKQLLERLQRYEGKKTFIRCLQSKVYVLPVQM